MQFNDKLLPFKHECDFGRPATSRFGVLSSCDISSGVGVRLLLLCGLRLLIVLVIDLG